MLSPTNCSATHSMRSDGLELGSCATSIGRILRVMTDDDDFYLILNTFGGAVQNRNAKLCLINRPPAAFDDAEIADTLRVHPAHSLELPSHFPIGRRKNFNIC